MPRTPRLFIAGKVYEICFRTEEGLPLVCSEYMTVILRGILAAAFSRYQVELGSFLVMGNHIHMHVRVLDPEQLDDLVCYIKRESSHAINNLLGRQRHTVWAEGYDAVLVLDAEKMIERLAYVFLNVARANLETSIEAYPGLSSWKSLTGETTTLVGRRIPREAIPELRSASPGLSKQQELADALLEEALPEQEVRIDTLAFVTGFNDSRYSDPEKVRAEIIQRVKKQEQVLAETRERPVIGAMVLRLSSIRAKHAPKKFGKKMWCFGSTKEIRLLYIDWFKEQLKELYNLKKLFSVSEYLKILPPGFFTPGGLLRANVFPAAVPI